MRHLMLLVLLLAAGCATSRGPDAGLVHHVVLCWLKDAGNAAERGQLIEVSNSFRRIPGVLAVRAGDPLPSDRPIVDDSFDVAIVLTFANPGDLAAYLEHPLHQKAQAEVLGPLVRKVVVYDFREPVQDPVR